MGRILEKNEEIKSEKAAVPCSVPSSVPSSSIGFSNLMDQGCNLSIYFKFLPWE
jgi:hypothetical protein